MYEEREEVGLGERDGSVGMGEDGDNKENIQGPQSNFFLGSGARFSRGRERTGLKCVKRSEAMELGRHLDLGQPSLAG